MVYILEHIIIDTYPLLNPHKIQSHRHQPPVYGIRYHQNLVSLHHISILRVIRVIYQYQIGEASDNNFVLHQGEYLVTLLSTTGTNYN